MGNFKYPRLRMYWTTEYGISFFFFLNTGRDRFLFVQNKLHFTAPNFKDMNDQLFKVRPLYNCIRARCNSMPMPTIVSIDEQMISFEERIDMKQYIKNKPTPWSIKNFILAGTDGFVYDFILYQGKKTELNWHNVKNFGLGASIILHFVENWRTRR